MDNVFVSLGLSFLLVGENKKVTQFFWYRILGRDSCASSSAKSDYFVTSEKGLAIKELYDPLWISGIINTSRIEMM